MFFGSQIGRPRHVIDNAAIFCLKKMSFTVGVIVRGALLYFQVTCSSAANRLLINARGLCSNYGQVRIADLNIERAIFLQHDCCMANF